MFVDGYGPQGLGPLANSSASAAPSGAEQQTLIQLGLRDTDLGGEFSVHLLSGGDALDKPTLHFCGADYQSEYRRINRWLVGAYDTTGALTGPITDAVRYDSAQGAQSALEELRSVLKSCTPNTQVNVGGTWLTVVPKPTTDIGLTGTVPANQRAVMSEVLTDPIGGTSTLIQTIWQVQGVYLVSLTLQHDAKVPVTKAEQLKFTTLAASIASRLAAAPQPS